MQEMDMNLEHEGFLVGRKCSHFMLLLYYCNCTYLMMSELQGKQSFGSFTNRLLGEQTLEHLERDPFFNHHLPAYVLHLAELPLYQTFSLLGALVWCAKANLKHLQGGTSSMPPFPVLSTELPLYPNFQPGMASYKTLCKQKINKH